MEDNKKDNEKLIAHQKAHPKTQIIRIIDVAFIGPVSIYAGAIKSTLPLWIRISLIGIGVATIYYNAKNFLWVENVVKSIKEGKGKNSEE